MKIVDLSRELYHKSPTYPGHPPIIHGVWTTHEESFAASGNVHGLSSMFISMPDHAGTHIDAFRHFNKDGRPISEYPLENCIVPGICLDLRHIAPRAEIAPDDLAAAVKKSGDAVPKGGTVLLCTGHHARTFPRKEYASENSGVNVAATEWLAAQGVVHFGIDSMRPGPRQGQLAGAQDLRRAERHPHREPVQSGDAARPRPLHLHRPAPENARRHGIADPRGRRIRDVRTWCRDVVGWVERSETHRPLLPWREDGYRFAQGSLHGYRMCGGPPHPALRADLSPQAGRGERLSRLPGPHGSNCERAPAGRPCESRDP